MSFFTALLPRITTWLSDTANGIQEIVVWVFKGERAEVEELCLDSTWITETELQSLLNQNNFPPAPAPAAEVNFSYPLSLA